MTVAIVIATWLGINPPASPQAVALAFGIAAASIFPALMMVIFLERINSAGATAGMLAGLISTCAVDPPVFGLVLAIPGTNTFENVEANWLLGISPLSFGAVGAIINSLSRSWCPAWAKRRRKKCKIWWKVCVIRRGAGGAVDH